MVAPLDPAHVRNLVEVRAMLDGLASAKVAEVAANVAKKKKALLISPAAGRL